jgi:transcriptional regulator with XRE-family HTH domain
MKSDDSRRLALGEFIRSRREQLSPPVSRIGRRRTPGWRREELAEAASIGTTWITWLEQGREVNISAVACARLATALQLNAAERASLFSLANRIDPELSLEPNDELANEILELPSKISIPAYILDHAWTAKSWNKPAEKLFCGWLDKKGQDKNLLRFMFLNDEARKLVINWPERASRVVAEFRADFNRYLGDADLVALADELSTKSIEFRNYWRSQNLFEMEGGVREFLHPSKGAISFIQTTLLVSTERSAKLVCLSEIN